MPVAARQNPHGQQGIGGGVSRDRIPDSATPTQCQRIGDSGHGTGQPAIAVHSPKRDRGHQQRNEPRTPKVNRFELRRDQAPDQEATEGQFLSNGNRDDGGGSSKSKTGESGGASPGVEAGRAPVDGATAAQPVKGDPHTENRNAGGRRHPPGSPIQVGVL